MKSNKNPRIARAAYMVEGSGTFIGVFGHGPATRCRVVTVTETWVSIEVMTVPQTKERFEVDQQLGFVREIEDFVFTNMETKAFARMLELVDVAPNPSAVNSECKVIPFVSHDFDDYDDEPDFSEHDDSAA